MAVVDYERAWHELLGLIAGRPGWGSASLALEASRIAARNQVSEGFVDRALRMYGGELTFSAAPGGSSSTPDGTSVQARGVTPATEDQEGDHDGSEHPRR